MTALAPLLLFLSVSLGEPPLPDRPDRNPPPELSPPVEAAPGTGGDAGAPAAPSSPRRARPQATLVGAGALGLGGGAWLAEAGYPFLEFDYAQGITARDDLGGTLRLDWTTAEMLLAAQWRRQLDRSEGYRLGFRLVGGPWFDFAATWVYGQNRSNVGVQVWPGIAWTPEAGPGLLTLSLDLGLTWAFQRGMGVAAAPALGLAYEVPLARDVTAGARAALSVRWGTGSAEIPGLDSHLQGGLTVFATWRTF